MKSATGRLAQVPALVLGVALMVAPDAAPAGEAIVPPLPGGATGSRPPASAEAAPNADAGTAGREEGSKGQEGQGRGSRLLRALADGPERGNVPANDAAPVFMAEGCPRTLLRRLLAGAVGEAGALSALGIEREVLVLCRERREIVTGLYETEARLRELRAPGAAPEPPVSAPPPAAAHAPAVPAVAAVEPAAPSPLRAALTAAAGTQADTEPPAPSYGWFSIIGSAGALRAGVTDGDRVWFVREGDPLPGGATVAAIAGRPPGVRVTGADESGKAVPLPWRARPGGGP